MVQRLGDLAGQLGLVSATLIAAAVYGILFVAFERFAAKRVLSRSLSKLECLLVLGLVVWVIFRPSTLPPRR